MSNDIINASFEMMGAIFLAYNCFKLFQSKYVAGVSIITTAFFSLWGFWNLWYYPSLDQTFSFIAGIFLVFFNALWVILAIIYSKRKD